VEPKLIIFSQETGNVEVDDFAFKSAYVALWTRDPSFHLVDALRGPRSLRLLLHLLLLHLHYRPLCLYSPWNEVHLAGVLQAGVPLLHGVRPPLH